MSDREKEYIAALAAIRDQLRTDESWAGKFAFSVADGVLSKVSGKGGKCRICDQDEKFFLHDASDWDFCLRHKIDASKHHPFDPVEEKVKP